MPRRNLVPFALLGVLAVLTVVFAVVGASSAPSGATVAVQNGSTRTFGDPAGTNSFTMDVVNTVSTGARAPTASQVRLIVYEPPSHMAVYQGGTTTKLLGLLTPSEIDCDLSVYTSLVGGPTAWTPQGNGAYQRTESLAAYSARVPSTQTSSCTPVPAPIHGQVQERAVVRSDYLVGLRLTVLVPAQKLANGLSTAQGVEGQALVLTHINGTGTRSLSP